ncbi:t-SNARE coiled-coil-like proteiny domain-containing protein [Mycena indigotica]|uniref:t-SNARE coiled-coil-like proteiny domain-containing protein n=1 Tax=Mycena indigotica TaxID=2126181 RepID=A0A8H6WI14_9AGAR|nr:t-SNARE coiled-coil-like proteiny domain-containing protein [Mycena indigotica]KAF7315648.1 t-SNARE coiled-coil-like proteiny domain-containing protein [Mycena indigotica]
MSLDAPLIRSRTSLFLSYRESRLVARPRNTYPESPFAAGADDDEREGLIQQQPAVEIDLPPKWVDISEQVQDILADTHAKITALEKLHAKHVLPGFTDRTLEEREIENLTTDITKVDISSLSSSGHLLEFFIDIVTQDFRRCQGLIQRIGTTPHSFPPSHSTAHTSLAAKNVQRGLAAKVQELSATFRKKQRVYMEKLQGHAIKNQDLLIASGAVSLKGSDGLSALDDDVAAATHTQVQSLATEDHTLTTRDRELTEIAKSISQLAELFKDLSVLVIDQGTLLDSVEYNIEQTAFQVEDAVKELKVATGYQKNTGRRQLIFLLVLIIFGLIVVLILKPKKKSKPDD